MSSSEKTNFTIVPATTADAAAILSCVQNAYASNLIDQATYPKELAHLTSPEDLRAWRLARIESRLNTKGALWFKAVPSEEPHKLAGIMCWYPPGHFSKAQETETKTKPDPPSLACRDDTLNRELLPHFDTWRDKIWAGNADYWYLATLTVDPDYQLQGVGGLLMREGLRIADASGLPSYVQATPEGTPVYPRFGYARVGQFEMMEGRHVVTLLLREAREL